MKEEQVIGKQIDGKTLYRKIIKRNDLSTFDPELDNPEMVDSSAIVFNKNGDWHNVPYH